MLDCVMVLVIADVLDVVLVQETVGVLVVMDVLDVVVDAEVLVVDVLDAPVDVEALAQVAVGMVALEDVKMVVLDV